MPDIDEPIEPDSLEFHLTSKGIEAQDEAILAGMSEEEAAKARHEAIWTEANVVIDLETEAYLNRPRPE